MTQTGKPPLSLGPQDLAAQSPAVSIAPIDHAQLSSLITHHLDAHLPILVDQAVAEAVEPIARKLAEEVRSAILSRLKEERAVLVEDIMAELHHTATD